MRKHFILITQLKEIIKIKSKIIFREFTLLSFFSKMTLLFFFLILLLLYTYQSTHQPIKRIALFPLLIVLIYHFYRGDLLFIKQYFCHYRTIITLEYLFLMSPFILVNLIIFEMTNVLILIVVPVALSVIYSYRLKTNFSFDFNFISVMNLENKLTIKGNFYALLIMFVFFVAIHSIYASSQLFFMFFFSIYMIMFGEHVDPKYFIRNYFSLKDFICYKLLNGFKITFFISIFYFLLYFHKLPFEQFFIYFIAIFCTPFAITMIRLSHISKTIFYRIIVFIISMLSIIPFFNLLNLFIGLYFYFEGRRQVTKHIVW